MKSAYIPNVSKTTASPPSRGAWIEIGLSLEGLPVLESPPSRGAWIEIPRLVSRAAIKSPSPPSRGAWIEMN